MLNGVVLALTKFDVRPNLQNIGRTEKIVEIVGRWPGIIGWFMSMLRVDLGISFEMNPFQINFHRRGLFLNDFTVIPITQVASFASGFRRRTELLILAAPFLLYAIYLIPNLIMNGTGGSRFLGCAVVSALFILAYSFLGPIMFYRIETTGGKRLNIRFGRSILDNIKVDRDLVLEAGSTINTVIIHRQLK
jgi:hypothetical protein